MKTLFIFGYGYSASLFAQQALLNGWRVRATTRSKQEGGGVEFFHFDGVNEIADKAKAFDGVTHILHSIAPDKDNGDCVINLHMKDLQKIGNLEWFAYLSTTGVYGNYEGGHVDETSDRQPTSARARARKQAEDDWLASGLPVQIFRLAGIYGPERNVFKQLSDKTARPILKKDHKFSRIHRDDIAGVLWASLENGKAGHCYNVCDDLASEPLYVLEEASRLSGYPLSSARPFEEAVHEMSPMARTFWQDNKTVSNDKMKSELRYQLKYPTYHEGLKAIWQDIQDGN